MFELKNSELKNQKFAIDGKIISSDENGVIKVDSKEVVAVLEATGFALVKSKKEKEWPKEEPKEWPKEEKKKDDKKPMFVRRGEG